MSLLRMAELAVDNESKNVPPVLMETKGKSATKGPAMSKQVTAAVDKVAAFIPSEVIGIYVAGLGIFSPVQQSRRWMVFGVGVLLVPVFVGLGLTTRRRTRGMRPRKPLRPALILSLMGVCAFAVWAAALPETPFLALSNDARQFGGWGAVILAGLLPRLATRMGVV